MRSSHAAAVAALVASTALPPPARAHVTLETQQAVAGATFRAVFRVPHGCEGHAATVRLTVRLPDGVTGARPMPKPGWTLAVVPRPGEPAQGGHGGARGEAAEIVWEGGRLDDAHYDEFVIRLRLPDEPGLLYIPAVQDCAGGGRAAWEQVPEPGRRASDYPFIAPAVRLTPRN